MSPRSGKDNADSSKYSSSSIIIFLLFNSLKFLLIVSDITTSSISSTPSVTEPNRQDSTSSDDSHNNRQRQDDSNSDNDNQPNKMSKSYVLPAMSISETTKSSSSSAIPLTNDEMIKQLKNIPLILSEAVNSGDLTKIQSIINEHCINNCEVKVPALSESFHDRQYILLLYESLLNTHPDFVLVTKKSKLVNSTISCKINFTGTNLIETNYTHLFKPKKCDLVGNIIKAKKISAEEEIILRKLADVIDSEGKKYLLWGGGMIMMTFDPITFKIIRFEMTMKLFSFKESSIA